MTIEVRGQTDDAIRALVEVLTTYEAEHPECRIALYRRNSASIRIRVIDPSFASLARADRHDRLWRYFEPLPDSVQSQVSLLVAITPEELSTSLASQDFDRPVPAVSGL